MESTAAGPASSEPEGGDEVEVLTVPEPCVLCGRPAGQRVEGFAQHLDPAGCQDSTAGAQPAPVAGRPAPASKPSERAKGPARRAFQEQSARWA